MTIRRVEEATYNREPGQGVDVPPGTAAAQVSNVDRAFSDKGQRYFPDVQFPADTEDILSSAIAHGAPGPILDAIASLPDRTFRHPDELPDLYDAAGIR